MAQWMFVSQTGSLGWTFPYFILASEGWHAAAGTDQGSHKQMLVHTRGRPGHAGRTEQGRDASGEDEASVVQERRVWGRRAC